MSERREVATRPLLHGVFSFLAHGILIAGGPGVMALLVFFLGGKDLRSTFLAIGLFILWTLGPISLLVVPVNQRQLAIRPLTLLLVGGTALIFGLAMDVGSVVLIFATAFVLGSGLLGIWLAARLRPRLVPGQRHHEGL